MSKPQDSVALRTSDWQSAGSEAVRARQPSEVTEIQICRVRALGARRRGGRASRALSERPARSHARPASHCAQTDDAMHGNALHTLHIGVVRVSRAQGKKARARAAPSDEDRSRARGCQYSCLPRKGLAFLCRQQSQELHASEYAPRRSRENGKQ